MPLVWQNDTLRMYYIHAVLYGIICIATALVADAIPSLLAHVYLPSLVWFAKKTTVFPSP